MCVCVFFFFKQKTAYEMRISDWSSDVCSSDLSLGGSGGVRRSRNGVADLLPRLGSLAFLARQEARLWPSSAVLRPCGRSEEHPSELQALMPTSHAVFCLKNKKRVTTKQYKIVSNS